MIRKVLLGVILIGACTANPIFAVATVDSCHQVFRADGSNWPGGFWWEPDPSLKEGGSFVCKIRQKLLPGGSLAAMCDDFPGFPEHGERQPEPPDVSPINPEKKFRYGDCELEVFCCQPGYIDEEK